MADNALIEVPSSKVGRTVKGLLFAAIPLFAGWLFWSNPSNSVDSVPQSIEVSEDVGQDIGLAVYNAYLRLDEPAGNEPVIRITTCEEGIELQTLAAGGKKGRLFIFTKMYGRWVLSSQGHWIG